MVAAIPLPKLLQVFDKISGKIKTKSCTRYNEHGQDDHGYDQNFRTPVSTIRRNVQPALDKVHLRLLLNSQIKQHTDNRQKYYREIPGRIILGISLVSGVAKSRCRNQARAQKTRPEWFSFGGEAEKKPS
jgi:hypothetical protein